MSNFSAALDYAIVRRWRIFPCGLDKTPLIQRGLHAASNQASNIIKWWESWPDALIGLPTGTINGFVVLDVDVKRPEDNGFDTLATMGYATLPDTPLAHTPSGGVHLYFALPIAEIRNTSGKRGRGIGPGLDWRGCGGYVIAPSPSGGYAWDPHHTFEADRLAEVPINLLPRESRPVLPPPRKYTGALSPYAEAALARACQAIVDAPNGEQEATLNGESFSIGTLSAAGQIPADLALDALMWTAQQMVSHDPHRPWSARELDTKVRRAFADGLRHPREVRRAG